MATIDERVFELPHDTGFKLNPNDAENIILRINRALHGAGISSTRVERVRCTEARRLLCITAPASTLKDLLQHRDMALQAARTVDTSTTNIVAQQKWMWTRIHIISLTRYMGRERGGGLRKLWEELEAENSGLHIPAEIRWLGGAKVRTRFRAKKEGAFSMVTAVLGEATFNRLCRYGVRLFGAPYDVDRYEKARPNAFCTRCSGWGRIAPHCKAADSRCSICAKDYEEANHQCPVEGYKVERGHPCPHETAKCANYGGPHGARADACAAKRKAQGEARGWRRSLPPARRVRGAAEALEEPEIEATAVQGKEEDEAEAEVEEGGPVRAAMEMEE